jgi:exodeoxyribonuclease VII large subunit
MHEPDTTEGAFNRVLSVSEITQAVRMLIEEGIGSVWVEGEISNLRRQASGHQYFTLKDSQSQLSCVLFRGRGAGRMGAPALADGQQVQVFGLLTVYEARGQYQLNVQLVQPRGAGALQAKFEALKKKLFEEGLFDAAKKKPIPEFPQRIVLVTSPTGAAIRDLLHVLSRRAPWVQILVRAVRVQGAGAAEEIARAIQEVNDWKRHGLPQPDLIIAGRGGGSIEDLWAFNEEIVARAISASEIPVISAVGHEIDYTIADFVADLRAPTPSAAAELAVPDRAELLRHLAKIQQSLAVCAREKISRCKETLQHRLRGGLEREPRRRLEQARQQVDDCREEMDHAVAITLERLRNRLREREQSLSLFQPSQQLAQQRERLEWRITALQRHARACIDAERRRVNEAAGMLRLLGPQATLDRGFSITLDAEGHILRKVAEAKSRSTIRTRLADGTFDSQVLGGNRESR